MKKEEQAKLPKVEWFPIGKIKPHPENPRGITQRDFDNLVDSIKEDPGLFHARPLLLSDRTGELIIVGGDKRFRAAKKLGWKTVPGIILSGLNEIDEKRVLAKDNGKWGEWDWDILANSWSDYPLGKWGIHVPEINSEIKEIKIKPYKKIYFLVIADPDQAIEVKSKIQQIVEKFDLILEESAN